MSGDFADPRRHAENTARTAAMPLLRSACVIAGVHTQVAITIHTDRITIILTQLQKIGTVLDIRRDTSRPQNMMRAMVADGAWRIRTLLGWRDDVLLQLLARQLAEKVGAYSPLPLLLCVALAGRRAGGGGGRQATQEQRRHDLFADPGADVLHGLVGLVMTCLASRPLPER